MFAPDTDLSPTIRTFAITAMGRSGTKFLATVMNRSSLWTVAHEPSPSANGITAARVQKRFARPCYGEVNSYLRVCFADLRVDKKGVILRDPFDIALSTANRGGLDSAKLRHLAEGIALVERHVDAGHRVIRFEHLTTDPVYLAAVLADFGIHDIDLTTLDLSHKINASPGHRHWSDLPAALRHEALSLLLLLPRPLLPHSPRLLLIPVPFLPRHRPQDLSALPYISMSCCRVP